MKTAITAGQWTMLPCTTPDGLLAGYSKIHYNYFHRFPNWMPLKLHLIIEGIINRLPVALFKIKTFNILMIIIHGKTCAYTTQEIKDFIENHSLG